MPNLIAGATYRPHPSRTFGGIDIRSSAIVSSFVISNSSFPVGSWPDPVLTHALRHRPRGGACIRRTKRVGSPSYRQG